MPSRRVVARRRRHRRRGSSGSRSRLLRDGGGGRGGDRHDERTAFAQHALDRDGSPAALHDLPRDGQPEARATPASCVTAVDLSEPVEHRGQLVLGDPPTPVGDSDGDGAVDTRHPDHDRGASLAELDGVAEQVGEDLDHAMRIHDHVDAGPVVRWLDDQADARCLCRAGDPVGGVLREGERTHLDGSQGHPPGVESLEVEDVVDELAETFAVGDRHRHQLLLLVRQRSHETGVEHLQAALDGRQRRAQLMADHGDELPLDLVHLEALRDIAEGLDRTHDAALDDERGHDDLDGECRAVTTHVPLVGKERRLTARDQGADGALLPRVRGAVGVLVVGDVMEAPPEQVALPASKHASCGEVREEDESLAVQPDDPVACRVEDQLGHPALLLDRRDQDLDPPDGQDDDDHGREREQDGRVAALPPHPEDEQRRDGQDAQRQQGEARRGDAGDSS